jgi:hypothetical protein
MAYFVDVDDKAAEGLWVTTQHILKNVTTAQTNQRNSSSAHRYSYMTVRFQRLQAAFALTSPLLRHTCIKCKVLDISSVFPMTIPQAGCRSRHCFRLPKPCRIFPRCDVNREKSDVMTYFGLIDRSDVFCVITRAGFLIGEVAGNV